MTKARLDYKRDAASRQARTEYVLRAQQGSRVYAVAANVEVTSSLESILALLDKWPEQAEVRCSQRENVERRLKHARSGGRFTYADEQSIQRMLAFFQGHAARGIAPPPPDPRSEWKPKRAKYRRAPLADFLRDPETLPKAPPGRAPK